MRGSKPITINNPGDAHELTFSCYRRLPLLSSEHAKRVFLENLNKARKEHKFEVWAYVIMPEHVHLLLYPLLKEYSIEAIRKSIKQQTASSLLAEIRRDAPVTARQLVCGTRDGNPVYRFWQKGKGFDRNMYSPKAIWSSIDYIHANPVRRRLCESELEYAWSKRTLLCRSGRNHV